MGMPRLCILFVLAGCSAPRVCAPGETRICAGPNGCAGLRACDAAGTAFGDCTCARGTAGGSTAGGSTGGGAAGGSSGGPTDAGCPLPCGSSCCRYKELCGADGGCFSDFDVDLRPYCAPCPSGGGVDTCGAGANYCLRAATGNSFCGADCARGQLCPAGYVCRDIAIVFTRFMCSAALPACPANASLPCSGPQDCRRGGTCTAQGLCAGVCAVAEGATIGRCSCLTDDDCAQDSCANGQCAISRAPCVTSANCAPIRCVDAPGPDGTPAGKCLIGQNCAPAPGLTCSEVG